jgi:hypothetical protein
LVSAASNSRQLSDTSTVPNGSVGSLDSSREIELEKQEQKKKQLEIRFIKFTEGHNLKLQAAAVFFNFNKLFRFKFGSRPRFDNQLS